MDDKNTKKPYIKQKPNRENYEKNLKLQLESFRKDLDIMLTSVIPNQLSLVRMYLWFNASIFGGLIAIFANQLKYIHIYDMYAILYILCFIISCASLIIGCWSALSAISKAKYRMLPKDMRKELSEIPSNSQEHVNGINCLIAATLRAKNENQKNIEETAQVLTKSYRYIRISLILAIIFGVFTLYINLEKGGINMADDKNQKPVADTSTAQPEKLVANSITIATENEKTQPLTESKDKPQQESEKKDK
ncbi:hypothetical protein [Helicobacter ganmani]|uniref:hypothetical protein n=1 Tax=Helicobacter ganmani TaxID=60246 RepID=UPI003A844F3F